MDEKDERIGAWLRIAEHPFFKKAYEVEHLPLIDAMLEALDGLMAEPVAVASQAEEPVESRILRAFTNGYSEGLRRATEGRFDR